jgi:hypothetical protein
VTKSPTSLDAYVIDTLLPDLVGHDRQPSAFLVYLVLWHRSAGSRARTVALSHRDIAESAGLSRRAVQSALATLVRRKLLSAERDAPTAVPVYTVLRPWHRPR